MSDQNNKVIDPKEFQEFGYLQEVNRLFFHPLGLALAVKVDSDSGQTSLECIYDSRQDPEGYVFGIASGSAENVAQMMEKAARVQEEWTTRGNHRQNTLGFAIEPITLNP